MKHIFDIYEDGCCGTTSGNTIGMGNPMPAGEGTRGSEPLVGNKAKCKKEKCKKEVKEGILDDIEDNLENTKDYNEIAHTFNWIAGHGLVKDYKKLKGGTRYNIERLIGKKHKNNNYYAGPVLDRMIENKNIFKKEYNFKTHIYGWLSSIILETNFDKLIDEYGDWEICSKISKDSTNKLNALLLNKNSEEQFYVETRPLLSHFIVTIGIKRLEEKYVFRYKLCEFTFPISEYRTKNN